MLTAYKFWYIKRDDNGFITEAAIRFYEGELTTKNEIDDSVVGNQTTKSVTRFRFDSRLSANEFNYLGVSTIKEQSNKDCALFDQSHFGRIKTDDELRLFLNNQIAKDQTRTPIDQQNITKLEASILEV
jgi:hypothetical protein